MRASRRLHFTHELLQARPGVSEDERRPLVEEEVVADAGEARALCPASARRRSAPDRQSRTGIPKIALLGSRFAAGLTTSLAPITTATSTEESCSLISSIGLSGASRSAAPTAEPQLAVAACAGCAAVSSSAAPIHLRSHVLPMPISSANRSLGARSPQRAHPASRRTHPENRTPALASRLSLLGYRVLQCLLSALVDRHGGQARAEAWHASRASASGYDERARPAAALGPARSLALSWTSKPGDGVRERADARESERCPRRANAWARLGKREATRSAARVNAHDAGGPPEACAERNQGPHPGRRLGRAEAWLALEAKGRGGARWVGAKRERSMARRSLQSVASPLRPTTFSPASRRVPVSPPSGVISAGAPRVGRGRRSKRRARSRTRYSWMRQALRTRCGLAPRRAFRAPTRDD